MKEIFHPICTAWRLGVLPTLCINKLHQKLGLIQNHSSRVYYSGWVRTSKYTGRVQDHASEIVENLQKDESINFTNDKFYITSEGPDLLSEELLNCGVSSLASLKWIYQGGEKVTEVSPYSSDGTTILNKKEIVHFENMPRVEWPNEPGVRVLSILSSEGMIFRVLPALIQYLNSQSGLYSCGRTPIYAIVPALEYKLLCAPREVLQVMKAATPPRCYIYSMLFTIQLLGKLTSGSIQMNKSNKKYKIYDLGVNWSDMYMIKIIPKEDLYENICSVEEITPMINSFLHLYNRSKNRLIPTLESLLPGVGPMLIYSGYTMNNTFMNVDLFNYHLFYQLLKSYPDYNNSAFSVMFSSASTNLDYEGHHQYNT